MSIPCCVPVPGGFECFNVGTAAECRELGAGDGLPGPEGTRCYDPDTGEGCFECARPQFGIAMNCCYPGRVYWPADAIFPFSENCYRCGGVAVANEEECRPQLPPPECREPEDDRAHPSGTRWTTDLIGTAAFGLSDGPGQDGLNQPVTDHLIRTRPPQADEGDSCAHVGGCYVVLEDGLMYVERSSEPSGAPDSSRYSYAGLMTAEGEEGLLEGCQYMMGGIHLPWWTEAILRSHQSRCGGWVD